MIARALDRMIGVFSPSLALKRMQARNVLRSYQGAESNRLNANKNPKNQSANAEMSGPFGADKLRAWARMLVRDNAYAWGVVDTIVSSVIGTGIKAQSVFETVEGEDIEDINDKRDSIWEQWCEVCDLNGQFTFTEIQQLAQREIVEAGECLIHLVVTPNKKHRGIYRPVPLALELIEADRLASDKDTYLVQRETGKRIVRGVEMDNLGRPVAYWIYPAHPNEPHVVSTTPKRIDAKDILHLYRRDRIGQSRGVSWFAPVVSWLRDLGVYVDNEIQSSAVASCFSVAITSQTPIGGFSPPSSGTSSSTTDTNGNQYEYIEPGVIMRMGQGDDVKVIDPTRPNASAEAWIGLMLRGIAVGTGLSYEIVARDFSQTNYSSNRASQLEDRRRFRVWQRYLINHLCQPVWDKFCDAAALDGNKLFPAMADLLDDRRVNAAVEFMPPSWEWVDPATEQGASESSIRAFQSTYQDELGTKGSNWRNVFYQRAKEERLLKKLGLTSPAAVEAANATASLQNVAMQGAQSTASGEFSDTGRRQFQNNRKAIEDILNELATGAITETKARVFLSGVGLMPESVEMLIADAQDGSVDNLQEIPEAANATT